MDFEKSFSDKCKALRNSSDFKIVINKVPTEFKLVRGAGGKIVRAFAVAKDDTEFVDYVGCYYGRAICFELKSTENKKSFPFGNIKDTQIEFLDKWIDCGGLGFYLIRFAYHNTVFMIDAKDLHGIMNAIDRKSVKYETCTTDPRFIELDYKRLNFEEFIVLEEE